MSILVTLIPVFRNASEMKTMEDVYKARLLELAESETNAVILHDAWKKSNKPVFSKWCTYNLIALEESSKPLLPSERKQLRAIVEFTPT